MRVRPTRPDPTRDYQHEKTGADGKALYLKTYANAESHWWDGSQIYGSNAQTRRRLRSDYRRTIKDAYGWGMEDGRCGR
jgi:Animal haem peroxidase